MPQLLPPLSLYIHIPWCVKKCPYCDFNSHKSPGILPEQNYVNALLTDLQWDLQRFPCTRLVDSIFIGGGTPSLFSADAFEILFRGLKKLLTFANTIEITMEANPGTVEHHRFQDYRALGINRLSLGIQSFNPKHLQALGRIHDDQQAHRAIENARHAGFDNINIDIMHGLPNQTIKEGLQDLKEGLAHQPEHLSWYQLTLEPNTVFYKQRPRLPTEDEAFALEEEGLTLLHNHPLHRYEISAFATKNNEARHNINYWLFGDYFGIGAGAHGKLTVIDEQGTHIFRTQKCRQPSDYLRKDKPIPAALTAVSAADLAFEFMLNATRLQQPIPNTLFTERTGLPFETLIPGLQKAIEQSDTHWHITPWGRRFTNDLQVLFLP